MGRSLATIFALALTVPVLGLPASSKPADRNMPMQFSLRLEGPAKVCGDHCRLIVAASGAITADTPVDFKDFAKGRKLTGALAVIEFDGGSVHGAIKLGREMRKLGLDTTVGRVTDLDGKGPGLKRASISPRADCESMCAFVLLAGVHRTVPDEARVMVHQIWLGDRRNDPTAASYSAEDLVLVQRDIGRLARYTHDMGASIEVLDLALRIPPWEPMHVLSRAEIGRTGVATADSRGRPPPRSPRPDAPRRCRGRRCCTSPAACIRPRSASAAGRWSIVPAWRRWRAASRSRCRARRSAISISWFPAAPTAITRSAMSSAGTTSPTGPCRTWCAACAWRPATPRPT